MKIGFISMAPARYLYNDPFISHLASSLQKKNSDLKSERLIIYDGPTHMDTEPQTNGVIYISINDSKGLKETAQIFNFSGIDIINFHYKAGNNFLHDNLLRNHLNRLSAPVVLTLHGLPADPDTSTRVSISEIFQICAKIIVMTANTVSRLSREFEIPAEKIVFIPYGCSDRTASGSEKVRRIAGFESRPVLFSHGLLSPRKGLEYVIGALPVVLQSYPDLLYVIAGMTHPECAVHYGDSYLLDLKYKIARNKLSNNMILISHYLDEVQLSHFINAADICVVPSIDPSDHVSGTLISYVEALKPVIATPFPHAREFLDESGGLIVPFSDTDEIAKAILTLMGDKSLRDRCVEKCRHIINERSWDVAAGRYMDVFGSISVKYDGIPVVVHTDTSMEAVLPLIRLDHLMRMTDSTGILQHAKYTVPDFHEGYCTDDNARGLILAMHLEELGIESVLAARLRDTCLAFLNYALDKSAGRFRNFMNFTREWLERQGSEDSHGRALWALGTVIAHTGHEELAELAEQLFLGALPVVEQFRSPRSFAFAVMGLDEYFKIKPDTGIASDIYDLLTNNILNAFISCAMDNWQWCENNVTYNNAILPQALLHSGIRRGNEDLVGRGLDVLRWLIDIQTAPEGHFRPVGSNGFFTRGGIKALFDQQPIEAASLVSACLDAYKVTGDGYWTEKAGLIFGWFLGHNDLSLSIYDASTGGCRDALHADRVNRNQGAESTVSFLLALAQLYLAEAKYTRRRN